MSSYKSNLVFVLLFLIAIPTASAQQEHGIQDTESAKHGYEAAEYQIIDTYEHAGFEVVQIELSVLSHYSYMLNSEGKSLVVDPGRDVEMYLDTAKKNKTEIMGVLLTHSHADFVAGHLELASKLKVPVYVNKKTGAKFEHKPIVEGDSIEVGNAIVKIIETPGHTPDGTCALVSSSETPDKPLVLFSGDTLFIGSVGRPDLLGEGMAASTLASMMFDTWHNKLSKLPDSVQLLPAHGAGSLCGAHLSDEPTSTIGEQRTANAYLQYKDRGEFVATILDGLPQAPQYFGHNAKMNHDGPELVDWKLEELPLIEPSESLTDTTQFYVADLRDAASFAKGHILNSVNIGIRGRFETWTGIMVPWESNLVVAGETDEQLREAITRLNRVGYKAKGIKIADWQKAKMKLATNPMITPNALYAEMQTKESPIIVDVRLPAEWMALRVGATYNIPLNELEAGAKKLDKKQRIVTVCNSAYRSSMAVGVMQRLGFENVMNMDGGSQAWIDSGLPVYEATSTATISATPVREIKLADRISAAELKRMMMDMPGTFSLVDIRPSTHFADYGLPNATNVELATILDNPGFLTGAGPLVIVDRDGSVAMMVGGILSQKTQRQIKVLYGGMEAYWYESDMGTAMSAPVGRSANALNSSIATPRAGPTSTKSATPSTQPATKPKTTKRKAGC